MHRSFVLNNTRGAKQLRSHQSKVQHATEKKGRQLAMSLDENNNTTGRMVIVMMMMIVELSVKLKLQGRMPRAPTASHGGVPGTRRFRWKV